MPGFQNYHVPADQDGSTLPAVLRKLLPKLSWTQVKGMIKSRRVQVNGNLCLDESRRVKEGDVVKVWEHALAKPADVSKVRVVHFDEHLVIVHKPAGITTLRHPEERNWPARRKQLQPTLDELVPLVLAKKLGIPVDPSADPRPPRPKRREARHRKQKARGPK